MGRKRIMRFGNDQTLSLAGCGLRVPWIKPQVPTQNVKLPNPQHFPDPRSESMLSFEAVSTPRDGTSLANGRMMTGGNPVNPAHTSADILGGIMNNRVAHLIVVLALLLTGGIAHAQIIGRIEADIPFPFHAGAAKFPAGKYTIRVEDGSDLSTMEIQSADGKVSALFEVRSAQAQKSPQSTELIFNHYGNRYFLARIFDEGEKAGSAVVDSGYSKKYGASLEAGETEHVAGRHSGS
jgi:hypothetical protein